MERGVDAVKRFAQKQSRHRHLRADVGHWRVYCLYHRRLQCPIISRSCIKVSALRQMIGQAASSVALLEGEGISQRYSNTIIDLLVLSLELQDLKTTHQELDLYGRMMSYIQQHLTEPELSIETIAVAHHVSTRTVTRAFARHQKSPVAEIWKERLNASRAAIECGQVRSVSQAALEFGFTDFSHFSHAFRKAFGVAPRTLLRGSGG